ncbi:MULTISPECIES: hypothetical protein [unclassified Streptomyces]|nr:MULTISPECIES: hypothetical protein [unclassified Streptomyces]MYY83028.1 hypothetical protein [Streptomyces sp. SID335]MYZ16996.1 hypothetical protein [Streptomyces sp. SID337]NDZ89769.1 hypothetical protein [Streptomyces sp. SID10115]NEB47472.1 hypothetical protein [Streptomyces sp. SID339]
MTPTDMGPAHFPTGHRRRTLVTVPASAESVAQRPQGAQEPPQHRAPFQFVQQLPHHTQHTQLPHHTQQQHSHQHAPHQQHAHHQQQQPHQAYPQQTYQQPYQQPPAPYQQPHLQDPPIYRALIRHWADRGRTLPGHHDAEWVSLAAPPVRHGQFSGSRDPRGDVR